VDIHLDNYDGIVSFATREEVDLACIGPEQPIVDGLWDKFSAQCIKCVGPSGQASIIESSKAWAKDFMMRHGIPTARYRTFKDINNAIRHLKSIDYEVVVKVLLHCSRGVHVILKLLLDQASGLASGKGVVIPFSSRVAEATVRCMLQGKVYGPAGKVQMCTINLHIHIYMELIVWQIHIIGNCY
jgi:phosphoribosylamine-glycine ligase